MSDPTWLPSTIMQTIGALYGIFIAIFILVLQSLFNYKKDIELNPLRKQNKTKEEQKKFNDEFNSTIDLFKSVFIVLAYFVISVEMYNGMLVYFISDSIFEKFSWLLLISYIFFIVLLVYIICFSYYMISFFISLEMDTPHFYNITLFKRICKIEFLDTIATLACIFISITIYAHTYRKLNQPQSFAFVFSIIVFLLLILKIWGGEVWEKIQEVKNSETHNLKPVLPEKKC
ncbi:hypothetical protein [Methanosarcina sp. 2.H.A.1B.4]|uniref:hypothetical protein n=1 Tax=Methanosarcina sp. 2.H.A.1B.4 TaxID=1483600 RepID=UPI00062190CC|nr:hypothetical protein [Methanosarcina sp. 2.H.A.1B.4]KKG13070.1 hypothetical protein EO92_07845 [Methanosarcina sp. 2.H.A.1B.4]